MIIPTDGRVLGMLLKIQDRKNVRLDDLAEELNLSTRTIRKYIKDINDVLPEDVAQLSSVKDSGLVLNVYDREVYSALIEELLNSFTEQDMLITPEERIRYISKVFLNSKKPINLDDLSEQMHIGRTTLVNDIKKLSKVLENYDLIIKGKPNEGVNLRGTELSKRRFIIEVISKGYDRNKGLEYIIGKVPGFMKEIFKKVDDIFTKSKIMHLDDTTRLTRVYISVLINRVSEGFEITELHGRYHTLKDTEEYLIASRIYDMIEIEHGIKLNEKEKIYLTIPLVARNASIKIDSNNIIISKSVKNLVIKILSEISDIMGVHIRYDEELITGLEYHINFALNRLIFNINIDNPMLQQIKTKYAFPYEMARVAASVIERTHSVKVTEDEIAFLALHFGSYVEKINMNYEDVNRVALVCSTGFGTAKLLFIKLRNMLGRDKAIHTFSENEISKEILDTYDLVLTTIPVNMDTSTPIIQVDLFFDERELEKKIKNRFIYQVNSEAGSTSNVSIVNMATKKNLFFRSSDTDYVEILTKITSKLYQDKEVDKDFQDRILKREITYPTAFANGVALPHAINKGGERLLICIIVPDKTVIYQDIEVKIIFMLLIPESIEDNPEILIKTYEEVLKICQNRRLLELLTKARSYNELTDIFVMEALK